MGQWSVSKYEPHVLELEHRVESVTGLGGCLDGGKEKLRRELR